MVLPRGCLPQSTIPTLCQRLQLSQAEAMSLVARVPPILVAQEHHLLLKVLIGTHAGSVAELPKAPKSPPSPQQCELIP